MWWEYECQSDQPKIRQIQNFLRQIAWTDPLSVGSKIGPLASLKIFSGGAVSATFLNSRLRMEKSARKQISFRQNVSNRQKFLTDSCEYGPYSPYCLETSILLLFCWIDYSNWAFHAHAEIGQSVESQTTCKWVRTKLSITIHFGKWIYCIGVDIDCPTSISFI